MSDYMATIESAYRVTLTERNQCRAALAMRNSDVQALVIALRKVVAFYDKIEAPHHPGEAKLLDELADVIKSIPDQLSAP